MRRILVFANGLATLGGILILAYGLNHQSESIFPFLILISKFGIGTAFGSVFYGHQSLFPVLFATTSFGFCNILGRSFASFSPLMAIIEQPTPMYAFTLSSGLAFISAFFLVEKVKEDNEESPKKHEVDQDVTVDATVCPDNDDDYKKVSY